MLPSPWNPDSNCLSFWKKGSCVIFAKEVSHVGVLVNPVIKKLVLADFERVNYLYSLSSFRILPVSELSCL